jgi:hypothetical protein
MLARKIMDSMVWQEKPSWWLKVWLYILMKVNHSDNAQFKRGTNFFNTSTIFHDCALYNENIKERSVRNVISGFRKSHMIVCKKTTRGVIITVVNYDQYQDFTAYKSPQESPTESPPRGQQKVHGKSTINNNDNNDNKTHTDDSAIQPKKVRRNKKASKDMAIKKDNAPTNQMIAIFTEEFTNCREGKPKIDAGKDGTICRRLWFECLSGRPAAPMEMWRERCRVLVREHDISTIGGVSAWWNTAIPKKKGKDAWDIARQRTKEMLDKEHKAGGNK